MDYNSHTRKPTVKCYCRSCSTLLITSDDITIHAPATALQKHKGFVRKSRDRTVKTECSSIIVKAESSTRLKIEGDGQTQGLLFCPKCNAKLGKYCWHGSTCSCGAWVTPAFMVQSSKVDYLLIP